MSGESGTTLTGNRGEWSEIYTLFKLLGERRLVIGDESFQRIPDLFFPILEILREEKHRRVRFNVRERGNVLIYGDDEKLIAEISSEEFESEARKLFENIRNSRSADGKQISLPETQKFMERAQCRSLKSSSQKKADIKIVIHDIQTGHEALQNFSIKSDLGSKPTLFNSNGDGTNFVYEVVGAEKLAPEIIERLGASVESPRERIRLMEECGARLRFLRVASLVLERNLCMVDMALPEILAYVILQFYSGADGNLSELAKRMDEENPLGFPFESTKNFYSHKIKRFLSDVALGLMPGRVWDGVYEANGGYIVVRRDGELLCYHIFYRNQFESYLLNSTKLETPGANRHHYGTLGRDVDGRFIFKLNLQIRFK